MVKPIEDNNENTIETEDLIGIGDKVRITLKPEALPSDYEGSLIKEGIISPAYIQCSNNGNFEVLIRILTDSNKPNNSFDIEYLVRDNIEKIELLKSAPESLIDEIRSSNYDEVHFELICSLLKLFY